ncbi:DNA-binding protein H-NS [Eumeta japonica]|uniref:DNA-binding protein H-NS n=1 Tax=Eumeta variegata TaxID=151549 RepID=A0A4C1SN34_EUMVA|nr:DNA-binding protein H-NS [Eumeta japonica]
MLEKLSVVVSERREEAQASEAANREKAEKLAKYRELLLQEGIDPNELLNGMPTTPAEKKNVRLVRLNQYTDENGDVKQWTGQGRTPSAIKSAIDADCCVIPFATVPPVHLSLRDGRRLKPIRPKGPSGVLLLLSDCTSTEQKVRSEIHGTASTQGDDAFAAAQWRNSEPINGCDDGLRGSAVDSGCSDRMMANSSPAIAGGELVLRRAACFRTVATFQAVVTGNMAISVVVTFEIVDIKQNQ